MNAVALTIGKNFEFQSILRGLTYRFATYFTGQLAVHYGIFVIQLFAGLKVGRLLWQMKSPGRIFWDWCLTKNVRVTAARFSRQHVASGKRGNTFISSVGLRNAIEGRMDTGKT